MAYEHVDYLNSNTLRSYPIKEGLSKVSTDGTFTIPDDFIVEFLLSATSNVAARFYISRITNLEDGITIEIRDDSDVVCGTFTITPSTHTLYKDYYLAANSDAYNGANGKITIGYVSTMSSLSTGTFYFTLNTAEFETRTIIPCLSTLNSVTFVDTKSGVNHRLTGDIKISARNNLRFTVTTVSSPNDAVILDAADGLGLNKKCDNVLPCIKTINSISPDGSFNFNIVGADCASITSLQSASGLLISDTCCKPCMGCDEVSELTERLMQLETDVLKLRDLFSNLQTVITEFSNTMNFQCDC